MYVKDVKDYKYSSIYSISHYSLKRALSENVKLDVIKVCSLFRGLIPATNIKMIFELHIIFPIPKVFASVSESVAICR